MLKQDNNNLLLKAIKDEEALHALSFSFLKKSNDAPQRLTFSCPNQDSLAQWIAAITHAFHYH